MNQFQKNLQRLAFLTPERADCIANTPCCRVNIATIEGKLNLQQEVAGESHYFHALNDPLKEAQKWFASLNLEGIQVLCVFGVGLGYYYEAAKGWLQDSNQYLVFLEHDPEVIHRLMETELGTQLLHDPQVLLQYFDPHDQSGNMCRLLALLFCHRKFQMSALAYYAYTLPEMYASLNTELTFAVTTNYATVTEYSNYGEAFLTNFYQNLLLLPGSYRGNALFGQFIGVPAIICGAGPSLDKNLALLETLGDKALIFAGGTAMNAVNSRNFLPTFGLSIDPHEAQMSRLIMNKAYETPFMYRNRMYPAALRFIHGDKLYVNGSGGYDISDWFEKELGIEGEKICEGHNVVNFSLSIAQAMGCNPIILVGLDLSYAGLQSYQSGVTNHPTNLLKKDFQTKGFHEELLQKNDINGQPVYTLWKWIAESIYYSQFVFDHPGILVINATEGGLGMTGIDNVTLKKVIETHLQTQYDFGLRVHGETQNSNMPSSVTEEKIRALLNELMESLNSCQNHSQFIIEELLLQADCFEHEEETTDELMTEKAIEHVKKLENEIAYRYLLYHFDDFCLQRMQWDLLKLENDTTTQTNLVKAKKTRLQAERYRFIRDTALINTSLIRIFASPQSETVLLESNFGDSKEPIFQTCAEEKYTFNNQLLTLIDPQLNLHFQETEPSGVMANPLYYLDGKVKIEQYFLKHKLHGPVTFFSPEGHVLAKSWYVNGLQQGKSWRYYSDGKLYSVQRFLDGKVTGIQEYFYKNGNQKTILNYLDGNLNGEISLYYPNGNKKRELHFKQGLRHGQEMLWDESGRLESLVDYDGDKPINKAQKWFPNGQLALEITYDNAHQVLQVQNWNENGSPQIFENEDYFDAVTKQTGMFTKSLDNVYDVLSKLIPQEDFKNTQEGSFQNDFEKLKHEMEHLHELNAKLIFESGLDKDNTNEAIWKTPISQQIIQQQLEEISKKMTDDISRIQEVLGQTIAELDKKKDEGKKG
jgi:antitoxin component YwqK of YwqJK toxin-antitoxin module